MIVLKNNQGTEENRERHLDYGVELSNILFEKYKTGEDIYLFSPHDVKDMTNAFYSGNFDEFNELYESYCKNDSVRKRSINSQALLHSLITERQKTGRIYTVFMENFYQQSPFESSTYEDGSRLASNLCNEIALPIKDSTLDNQGSVALCTLSSVNFGKVNKPSDLENPCRIAVRALDHLLSYQGYPAKEAEIFTKKYRALGVGVVGLAHFLAKRGLKYNANATEVVDEYMEAFMYYLIDESVELSKEYGACEGFSDTCYAKGIFPWEKRSKNIDQVMTMTTKYPWEELREKVKKYGIRNATLSSIAPTEASSQLLGETNGIEPPRAPIVTKSSKTGILKQVVPQYTKLKNQYDYVWDQKSPLGYLTLVGVMQKWVDQSISANTSYNPNHYPDGKFPMSILVRDIAYANSIGVKTLYYFNTNDTKDSDEEVVEKVSDNDCCVI